MRLFGSGLVQSVWLFLMLASCGVLRAQIPDWWIQRDVVRDESRGGDYSPANHGQLKQVASNALLEFNEMLPGGAGGKILSLILSWQSSLSAANDFAVLNLGQLKAVATLFHDRLKEEGYVWVPWQYPITKSSADDYAVANVGQLKAMFAFDLRRDVDQDGIPDWIEYKMFKGILHAGSSLSDYYGVISAVDGISDIDGDGIPDIQEYQNGTDPGDYYNGVAPVLRVKSGGRQIKPSLVGAADPLCVLVLDSSGKPLVNAPVKFSVESGDIYFDSLYSWTDTIEDVRTDSNGIAQVILRLGNDGGVISVEAMGRGQANSIAGDYNTIPIAKINVDYYGKAVVAVTGGDQYTKDDLDGVTPQLIVVRVLDSTGSRGVAGQTVRFAVVRGDAAVESSVEDLVATDEDGYAILSVLRGKQYSVVEVTIAGRVFPIEIDQQIPGAIEVTSTSMDGKENVFPADGVPILFLSRALPEEVSVDPATGMFMKTSDGSVDKNISVWLNYEQPSELFADVVLTGEAVKQIFGKWVILPGRKAIAFVASRNYSSYSKFCEPNTKVNRTEWPQNNLRFEIVLGSGGLFGAIHTEYRKEFSIADTPVFLDSLRNLSEDAATQKRLARTLESYLTEKEFRIDSVTPANANTSVSPDSSIRAKFTLPVEPTSLDVQRVRMTDEQGQSLVVSIDFEYDRNILVISPEVALSPLHTYTVTIGGGICSLSGKVLPNDFSWMFTAGNVLSEGTGQPSYFKTILSEAGRNDVALDSVFSFYVDPSRGSAFYEQSTAMLTAAYFSGYAIKVDSVYNPINHRIILRPQSMLLANVVYDLKFTPNAASSGSDGNGTGMDSKGSDGEVHDGSSMADAASFSFKTTGVGTGEENADGSDIAGSGVGQGSNPAEVSAVVEEPGDSPVDAAGELIVNKSFTLGFFAAYAGGGQGYPSLLFTATNLQGESTEQRWELTDYWRLKDGRFDSNGNFNTSPLALGSVIRIWCEPDALSQTLSQKGQGILVRVISVRNPPLGGPLDVDYKPAVANCNYLCFQRSIISSSYSIAFMDGVDGRFPGPGVALSVSGNDSLAPAEAILCPVIVRDEDDGEQREIDEVILSTRNGDLKYAPIRKEGESAASYASRLKAYFKIPYPRSCMAFIKGKSYEGDYRPAMPKLSVCIKEAPSGVRGCWRLRVQYDRGNGRGERNAITLGKLHPRTQPQDVVDIPGRPYPNRLPYDLNAEDRGNVPTYSEFMPANEEWKIFETQEWKREIETLGLFGGEAKLYWCPELKLGGSTSTGREFQVAHFRIGGENPANGFGRFWLESRGYNDEENVQWAGKDDLGHEGKLWFAYAIAKSETAEYQYRRPQPDGPPSFYNQFISNPKKPDLGYPTWNDDGPNRPGGYGVFQVTGDKISENKDIPRDQIWSWRQNMKAGGDIIRFKWAGANKMLSSYRNLSKETKIPPLWVRETLFSDDTAHQILAPMVMKRYNGLSMPDPGDFIDLGDSGTGYVQGFRVSKPERADFCFWDERTRQWALSRYNGLVETKNVEGGKKRKFIGFDYVYRVCEHVETLEVLNTAGK
ncbi:MAG: Ig-like domain-containing protein [Verrucomicrobiota bacterium]